MRTAPTIKKNSDHGFLITADAYAHGGKAWLAIVRKGGQFGLERTFGHKFDTTKARSNKYRSLELSLQADEGDQIEYASQESSTRRETEFFVIRNGELVSVPRSVLV